MPESGYPSDEDLILRAIRNARVLRTVPRWAAVSGVFALGSTYSKELCRRFHLDPDEMVDGYEANEEEAPDAD